MRFAFNEDQATFATFLGQMLASGEGEFRDVPDWGRYEYGKDVDARLEENGFFDVAREETLGLTMATAMVYEVAQLPVTVECAASAILRPLYLGDLPRPIAVVDGDPTAAIRFLPMAQSLVWIAPEGVRSAVVDAAKVTPVESLFAYPMGKTDVTALDWRDVDADAGRLANTWRLAVAAELSGCLKGGLEAVLTYVRERQQFGRPLGSFQGVQHRLASAAVEIEAAKWLALKAVQSEEVYEAAQALAFTQYASRRIAYDLHQFMGAMGLTLEHPLHRWTYRIRLLRAAFGGPTRGFQASAAERWGEA